MFSRLFALIILIALVLAGLHYWKSRPEAPENLRTVGRELKDTALTGAVKTAFELNRTLKPLPIHVSTEDGVVTLRGDVPRADAKDLAERVAISVPDVRQVVNHLHVTGGPVESPRAERTLTETVDDQALAVQVRLALSLNKELKGTDVKVDAFKREVTLSGEAPTAALKALAVQIAKDTPGVSGVTDRIHNMGEDRPVKP
jgi:osmotically-inducible protein OsmY